MDRDDEGVDSQLFWEHVVFGLDGFREIDVGHVSHSKKGSCLYGSTFKKCGVSMASNTL
jgi:hypothetical protein